MATKTPKQQFKPGDKIQANLHGRIIDATVRAGVDHTDGVRLQVDYRNDETALIQAWQVMNA